MPKWLRQYTAISWNALTVSLGSPFSVILQLSILLCGWLLACLPFFTFGEQLRLVRDQSLALCLLGGWLACALGAALVVSQDIRGGSAAVMMSRPVSSFCYVAGKWTGLLGSVFVIQLTAGLACLWLTEITAAEESLDTLGLTVYAAAIVVALAVVGVKHYLFGGSYVWQANLALLASFVIGFTISALIGGGEHIDWPTARASLLVFLALAAFASIAILSAVFLDAGGVLAVSVAVFFVALFSEYALSHLLGGWLLTAGRSVMPNIQVFWVSDRLAEGGTVSWSYIAGCGVHALFYSVLVLSLAAFFFGRLELEGRQ
jgi:hypothetical protein